MFMFP